MIGLINKFTIPNNNAAAVAEAKTGKSPTGLIVIPDIVQDVSSNEIVSTNQTTRKRTNCFSRCASVFIFNSSLKIKAFLKNR
jgi:hypothetical protein